MKYLIALNIALIGILAILVSWKHEIVYVYEPEVIQAVITAYSKHETCPNEECITASGKVATTGFVACPRAFKLGVRVEINGNEYVCEDRTSKKYDGRWDIWHDSYEDALEFGLQKQEVVIR